MLLDDIEGSVSIGGRLITNFRFGDNIAVNVEEEEEADVLLDRLDTTTTSCKTEIGPHKTKVMNGGQRDQDKMSEARSSGRRTSSTWEQSSLTEDQNPRFFPG